MTLNKTMIRELEHTYKKSLPEDLKKYLFLKYAEEPFPYEFSAQDLYANIHRDFSDYEAGKLDISAKSSSECQWEEREYLRNLYIEKSHEVCDLEGYIVELEQILLEHGLKSARMVKRQIECDF